MYLVCILETLESFMITAFFPAKSCKMENGELSHLREKPKLTFCSKKYNRLDHNSSRIQARPTLVLINVKF